MWKVEGDLKEKDLEVQTAEGEAEITTEVDQSQDQSLDQRLAGSVEMKITRNAIVQREVDKITANLPPQQMLLQNCLPP